MQNAKLTYLQMVAIQVLIQKLLFYTYNVFEYNSEIYHRNHLGVWIAIHDVFEIYFFQDHACNPIECVTFPFFTNCNW